MDSFRLQRSLGSERFLSPISPPDAGGLASTAVELNEDEVFWTGNESPEQNHTPRSVSSPPNPIPLQSTSPLFRRSVGGFRRTTERNFGILAALPEEEKKGSVIQWKPSISSSSLASTSPSSSSSSSCARLIPAVPKPKTGFSLSVPGGKIYHQSAPVNVPVVSERNREGGNIGEGEEEDVDGGEEMLPPHEIVARNHGMGSPMTTFSVLEGAGRTLKGRDLRRVRNAVWRQTGFLD